MKKLVIVAFLACPLISIQSYASSILCNMKISGKTVSRQIFTQIGNSEVNSGGALDAGENVGDIGYVFGATTFLTAADSQGNKVELKQGEVAIVVTRLERLLKDNDCEANHYQKCFKTETLDYQIVKLASKHQTNLSFKMEDGQPASVNCSSARLKADFAIE